MKIAFCFYKKGLQSSISIASDMLASASSLRKRHMQRSEPLMMYVVGDKDVQHENDFEVHLNIERSYFDDDEYDFVFLPPIWGNPIPTVRRHDHILAWLKKQHEAKATFIATGTGVCWLAQAGLLDNKTATTHWHFHSKFEKFFPAVNLNRKAAITSSDNIYCTRSTNSQTELLVYIISQFLGASIARVIEKNFMHEASSFQSEPFFRMGGSTQFDETVAIAQTFINQNLASAITLEDIADYSKTAKKTLTRKFKNEIGITPHKYLLQQRLQTSKSLLKDNSLSLINVAELSGFKDPHYFKTVFERHFQMSPLSYRKLVKAKPFHA
ncbi:helix-turn-helix domain-containing protein [Alteromonadaceae bacterium M269]|nr:helix-turn-helix domain-containing protein [Alteromonadaceae bacterium M269]